MREIEALSDGENRSTESRSILPFRGTVSTTGVPKQVHSDKDENQDRHKDHGGIRVVCLYSLVDSPQ